MSTSWTARILIERNSLSASSLMSLGHVLNQKGIHPLTQPDGSLLAMTGDGTGEVVFESAESAFRWLSASDGLISFFSPELDEEYSVSVCRGELLHAELKYLSDEPKFDELRISTRHFGLGGQAVPWQFIASMIAELAAAVSAKFVLGIDDLQLDLLQSPNCLHKPVSRGNLPDYFGALAGAPRGPLADQLEALADKIGAQTILRDGFVMLHL